MPLPNGNAVPSLPARAWDAAVRRGQHLYRTICRNGVPAVENSVRFLLAHVAPGAGAGSGNASRQPRPDWALVGACLETLAELGCREVLHRGAEELLSIQQPDGSLPDDSEHSSLRVTRWAAQGLLALADDPAIHMAAWRACECLMRGEDTRELPGIAMVLARAGQIWPDSPFAAAAVRAFQRCESLLPGVWREQSFDWLADWTEARIVLSGQDRHPPLSLARTAGEAIRPKTGSLPSPRPRVGQVLETARWAGLWYRLGERRRADQALAHLERTQRADGGWPAFSAKLSLARREPSSPWVVKHYLDAALLRVRTAFAQGGQELPDRIDPSDGRMQAVLAWAATLPAAASLADVGCGKGRFLRNLAATYPGLRLFGVDLSPDMLAQLPAGVTALQGSLLGIPLPDASVDAALAVESLEHSLLPERAVAEVCRIVRPGGEVLVIDKHRAKQALSRCEPWERWFTPEELHGWLSPWCEAIRIEPVAHGEGRPGENLFLAAYGTRKRPTQVGVARP